MLVYIHEDNFAVDRAGNVWGFDYKQTGFDKQLKAVHHSAGYLRYYVAGKNIGAHVLVARAFIPNPENKAEVDHIDGDKKNNCVENLRWVTHRENMIYARERLGNWSKKNNKKTSTKVETHLSGKKVKRYKSIADASREFGVKYATFAPLICRAIHNDWLCYGVRWRRV